MSNVMSLAIQFTAIDMLSSVVERARRSVLRLGPAAGKVKKDFDTMSAGITNGLKAIAISSYALHKALPGIKVAGDLQESLLRVKSNLVSSARDARDLDERLKSVRDSAVAISNTAPYSAQEVVDIEGSLLKAGVAMENVLGKQGAAWAATALATISGEAPEMIGDALARIGNMFNFKGPQYGEFSDWVARVDDASASTVPELVYGLRMAGGSAAALNISANETVTSLGALASLGERAGSSLANFFIAIAAKRKELLAGGIRLFEKGKFVGMERAIDILKEKFGSIKDDQQRLGVLIKIFGEEGGRAANEFINAKKGYKELNQEAQKAADLQRKMSVWAEGFNASLKKLAGTAKTTLAGIFDPLLGPLRQTIDLLNELTGKLGAFFSEHQGLATAVSGGVLAGAVGTGAYGIYSLVKGGFAGARVLKGLGGILGLLKSIGGIAEGKMVESLTGVTPVFVTNWPATSFGGPGIPGTGKNPPGTVLDQYGNPMPRSPSPPAPAPTPGPTRAPNGSLLLATLPFLKSALPWALRVFGPLYGAYKFLQYTDRPEVRAKSAEHQKMIAESEAARKAMLERNFPTKAPSPRGTESLKAKTEAPRVVPTPVIVPPAKVLAAPKSKSEAPGIVIRAPESLRAKSEAGGTRVDPAALIAAQYAGRAWMGPRRDGVATVAEGVARALATQPYRWMEQRDIAVRAIIADGDRGASLAREILASGIKGGETSSAPPTVKNEVNIALSIPYSVAPVTAETTDMNTTINLQRGLFYGR